VPRCRSLVMWTLMMIAMTLSSLMPTLRRYPEAVGTTGETGLGRLTTLVGVGYFFVWNVFGIIAFSLGAPLARIEMRHPALARGVPVGVCLVFPIAGALQFTTWKAHHLACCREAPSGALPADAGTAWRYGLRLGLHCSYCCAGLTAVLLAIGVMNLRAMAALTAAITLERLTPAGERTARTIGAMVIGAGLLMPARVAGLA
jgi:predicted metal-binding membrane protein